MCAPICRPCKILSALLCFPHSSISTRRDREKPSRHELSLTRYYWLPTDSPQWFPPLHNTDITLSHGLVIQNALINSAANVPATALSITTRTLSQGVDDAIPRST